MRLPSFRRSPDPLPALPSTARDLGRLYYEMHLAHVRSGRHASEQLHEIELKWRQASTIELATASGKEELLSACRDACPHVEELEAALKKLLSLCDSPEDGVAILPLLAEAPESCQKDILRTAYKLNPYSTTKTIRKLLQKEVNRFGY